METKLLTVGCHLLKPGWGSRFCCPTFPWAVLYPEGTRAWMRALKGWQTRAQIPTKQCPCRQTLRDLLDFILLGGRTWQVLPIHRFFGGIPVLGTVLCTSHTDIQSASCTDRNSSFHKQKKRKFEDFHFQIQET